MSIIWTKMFSSSADDTALSNPEAPVDPATPAEEGWMAPTPLLVEDCGLRGPDTSGKKKKMLSLLQVENKLVFFEWCFYWQIFLLISSQPSHVCVYHMVLLSWWANVQISTFMKMSVGHDAASPMEDDAVTQLLLHYSTELKNSINLQNVIWPLLVYLCSVVPSLSGYGSPANAVWDNIHSMTNSTAVCVVSSGGPHLHGYECCSYHPLRSSHVKPNQLGVNHECIRAQ